jgi:hypothetical protein
MAHGELAAIVKGLAKDATNAARKITESVARLSEQTADIEESNLANLIKTDAKAADDIAAVAKKGADKNLAATADVPRKSILGDEPLTDTDTSTKLDWSGAGHVGESSPTAEAAYAAIRANASDVAKIAGNTGIDQDIIGQVKNHLFLTEHDVPIGPNQVAHGYFTADEDIAALWNKAEEGLLSPSEQERFRSLMAHEYVEGRLMQAGVPYRSADPRRMGGRNADVRPVTLRRTRGGPVVV